MNQTLTRVTALLTLLLTALTARAQTPLWTMTVDVAALVASPLGRAMMDHARSENPQTDAQLDALTQAMGLDLRTDMGTATLIGTGFTPNDLSLVAELSSAGRLEGWFLGMPGYASQPLDDVTLLHSFLVEDEQAKEPGAMRRVWAALPAQQAGRVALVAAFDESTARRLTQAWQRGEPTTLSLPRGELVTLAVNDLTAFPLPHDDDKPGSAVLRALTAGRLSLSSAADITLTMELTAVDKLRARQVSQLLLGLLALPQLAAAEDPQAARLAELVAGIDVQHQPGSNRVTATGRFDHEAVVAMIHAAQAQHRPTAE